MIQEKVEGALTQRAANEKAKIARACLVTMEILAIIQQS